MKMLEMDMEDLQELSKISKEEALEFVAEGLPIICQTSRRDFYQIENPFYQIYTNLATFLYANDAEPEKPHC